MALHDPELRKLYDLKVCMQTNSCGQITDVRSLRSSYKPTQTLCLLVESPVMCRSEVETCLAFSNSDHLFVTSPSYTIQLNSRLLCPDTFAT